jgi:hypothetical protein
MVSRIFFHFGIVDNSVEDISDFKYFRSPDHLLGWHYSELIHDVYYLL